MKKWILIFLLFAIVLAVLLSRVSRDAPPAAGMDGFIAGMDGFIAGFEKYSEIGDEYKELGYLLQADFEYGLAAASISSMRLYVDWLIYLKDGGAVPGGAKDESAESGRLADWDAIAALNYASPYPWFFESLTLKAQGKETEAGECYGKAHAHPRFIAALGEELSGIAEMTAEELKAFKTKLESTEDRIFAMYMPKVTNYPRMDKGFDDVYLRSLGLAALDTDGTDYAGALRHFEAALAADPFDGDNFGACALMCLYMSDADMMFYYVNEGLYVDPDNKGLNELADALNKAGEL